MTAPRFSTRAGVDPHATNALSRARAAYQARGRRWIDLTVSNPTRAGFRYPTRALCAALSRPDVASYEPSPRGLRTAREAIAGYYAQAHGRDLDPDHIVLTASTSESYALIFKLLCDPGERVLAPRPSYPLLETLAGLDAVTLDTYPLGYDGQWHFDLAALDDAVTGQTRAVIVVNPNNPTGTVLRRNEHSALARLCAIRGLALVSDEVFADYAFGQDPARVTTVAGAPEVLTFALSGLSKVAGLPQIKLGWIVVSGPPTLRDEALARLEHIADAYLSVGLPAQLAAGALLELRATMRPQIAARTARNFAAARARVAAERDGSCTVLPSEGGWSLVLRVPAVQSEQDWALELLERDGVLVQPGYYFDFERGAYLVLSLLAPPEDFDAGLSRVLARVHSRVHRRP